MKWTIGPQVLSWSYTHKLSLTGVKYILRNQQTSIMKCMMMKKRKREGNREKKEEKKMKERKKKR